jgi:hypothetical protein
VILKMPESVEPDVTLVVHHGSAKLTSKASPGRSVEFAGVAVAFSTEPFMLTFDVDITNLRRLELVRPSRNQ